MIVRFFRFLGTVLFSSCDHDTDCDHLPSNSNNEYDHLQINGRANSKRPNHYQYNDDSIKVNLLAFVKSSVKSSNPSKWSSQSKLESNAHGSFHPTNIGSEASNSSLLSNQIKSPSEQSNGKLNICTNYFRSKSVSSSSPQRPGAVSFVQSNTKSNTSTSSFSTKTVQSSSPLRPDATCLSNNSITKPVIVTGYVVKSNSPKNSPASKPLPAEFIASSSSNAGPDPKEIGNGGTQRYEIPSPTSVQSFVKSSNASKWSSQSKLESNASKISPLSKLESNARESFHPTNIGSEISNSSFLFNQIKSPSEQSNIKSKAVSSSSPQRPGAVYFAQSNTSTSSFSTKTVRPDASNSSFLFNQIKSPSEQSNIKSKAVSSSSPQRPGAASFEQTNIKSSTSTSSFSTKTVRSSSPRRPDATSLSNNYITKPVFDTGYVVKSNSPKNSQASKPLLAEFITSSSSNAGSGQSEIEDPKEVGKRGTQRYEIPKNIEEMMKNDIVPPVLKMPLSPHTYADYFAALLYAEDFYCEKYSDYLLEDVALKLREKPNPGLQDQSDKKKSKRGSDSKTQKDYPFVAFEIKELCKRIPFLLSRDHVHLKPVDRGINFEPFHGVLFHFERGTILAEFKDDFHNQHKPSKRYNVSFSFNRVCLKRAHRAVSAAASPLLRKILFPKITSLPTQRGKVSPMDQILNHKLAPIPYLIEYERPPSFRVTSPVTSLIKNTVLKIYESCKESRILICTPKNRTCDDLVRLIMEKVCEFDIFRANAAFREKELVPDDIMPACIYRRECFTCPPLAELQRFRIITSTFVSTFRLYNAGLKAGHFSHIFLLDASSAIEPVTIVALVDLVSEETVIVVTGSVQDQPRWVRSDIGRKHGLKESFFERLRRSEPYWSDNPLLKTNI